MKSHLTQVIGALNNQNGASIVPKSINLQLHLIRKWKTVVVEIYPGIERTLGSKITLINAQILKVYINPDRWYIFQNNVVDHVWIDGRVSSYSTVLLQGWQPMNQRVAHQHADQSEGVAVEQPIHQLGKVEEELRLRY